jgi:hypothetical protein
MIFKGKEINFLLFLPLLFPYLIVFAIICIFTNVFMEILFQNNGLYVLLMLFIFYVLALICTLIFSIKNIALKKESQKILFFNMLIKLIQIPAYISIFIIGIMGLITIFTIGITIVLIILSCLTIFLTGTIGLSGIIRGFLERKLSLKYAILYAFLQFIFCIDVIGSIIIYQKVKK